jgi:hypothetical protein
MRRHRNPPGPRAPAEHPSCALRRWHPAVVRLALARGRLHRVGTESILVTASDDQQQIAHAAWSILAATGGVLDRGDIARRFGLSRGRVHQLTGQRHFPRPVQGEGTSHPIWLAVDVETYRSQPPRPGRPPKQSAGTS